MGTRGIAGGLAAVAAVEKGLPLKRLERLAGLGLSFTEVDQVAVPARTVKHRKSRGEPLSAQESDRVLRIERLVGQAEELFGEREKALRWLRRSERGLGGRTRLSLLKTESGGRAVEQMLIRIANGIYS